MISAVSSVEFYHLQMAEIMGKYKMVQGLEVVFFAEHKINTFMVQII